MTPALFRAGEQYEETNDVPQFGFGVAVGYDFNRDPRGFGLTLEAKYNSYRIEDMDWAGIAFVGNLCWK